MLYEVITSWAGILAPPDFQEFALPYVQRIFTALKEFNIPLIYFANNGATLLELSVESGADVIGLDWRINIAEAIRRVGTKAVQGNLSYNFV